MIPLFHFFASISLWSPVALFVLFLLQTFKLYSLPPLSKCSKACLPHDVCATR